MVLRTTSSVLALPWRLCLAVEPVQAVFVATEMFAVEAVEAGMLEQGLQSNSSNHLGH